MEINSQGAHQLDLRCRSVKVLLGAMNVFRMRAGSESGAGSRFGEIGVGEMGAAAIAASSRELSRRIVLRERSRDKRRSANDDRSRPVTAMRRRTVETRILCGTLRSVCCRGALGRTAPSTSLRAGYGAAVPTWATPPLRVWLPADFGCRGAVGVR